MSTYLSLGQVYFLTYLLTYLLTYFHSASLVCPPTPVKAKVLRFVGQPTPVYFLTYLLTFIGAT